VECGSWLPLFFRLPPKNASPPQQPASSFILLQYYCQIPAAAVCFQNVDFPPEERGILPLLYVLYACVFWRGEAELLGIQASLKGFSAHRQKQTGRWVFSLGANDFQS
jgi:hypothetical protein